MKNKLVGKAGSLMIQLKLNSNIIELNSSYGKSIKIYNDGKEMKGQEKEEGWEMKGWEMKGLEMK
jgi:hypothetical protein